MPQFNELDEASQALIITAIVFGTLATVFTFTRLGVTHTGEAGTGLDHVLIVVALIFYRGNIALNIFSTVIRDGGNLAYSQKNPKAIQTCYLVSILRGLNRCVRLFN